MAEIKDLAQQWISWDPNPTTRQEIADLVTQNNTVELEKRLRTRIAFGTAGLRGPMAAGFSCMNDLTVRQASQGLCHYILEVAKDAKERGIVVGYDGRHNSKKFAELTAATFIFQGVPVYLFETVIPTPFVAFGVTNLGCQAGIVITASHNPAEDNGYKVYWDNGCQIVSPVDSGVTKAIANNLDLWPIDWEGLYASALLRKTTNVQADYMKSVEKFCFHKSNNSSDSVKITYTAMHGVGRKCVENIFEVFGLAPFIPVLAQVDPNPDFPTVAFPNPEEGKGALKLSMETADANGSNVILANDPDADRLAAAEKDGGSWHIFTGNELGIILGHWMFEQLVQNKKDVDRSKIAVLNTTVSSKALAAFAKAEGLYYEETLTGFKWLGTAIERLEKSGYTFLFAFEEAIGYMVRSVPLDKDGVSAAAVFAEMAHYLYGKGTTILAFCFNLRPFPLSRFQSLITCPGKHT
jgi:phosphomannomutase